MIRRVPASGPAAPSRLPAGPGGTAAPESSSASSARPRRAAAAPVAQTSSPPSGSNDNIHESDTADFLQSEQTLKITNKS